MQRNWDLILSNFIELGGIAKNIKQKKGDRGRGIFAKDPEIKSQIFVPANLMIETKYITSKSNKLSIRQDNFLKKDIYNFLTYYLNELSFCRETLSEINNFEEDLNLFTPGLKDFLKKYLFIDIQKRHKGRWSEVLMRSFINSRSFRFNNSRVICPFLELVNYDKKSPRFLINKDGIRTPNWPPTNKELTYHYGNQVSVYRFFQYNFFSKDLNLFSYPFSTGLPNSDFVLICNGETFKKKKSLTMKRQGNTIIINGLQLKDSEDKNYLSTVLHEIFRFTGDYEVPKYFLRQIIKYNTLLRLKLIQETKSLSNNYAAKNLKIIIEYEINLLSTIIH